MSSGSPGVRKRQIFFQNKGVWYYLRFKTAAARNAFVKKLEPDLLPGWTKHLRAPTTDTPFKWRNEGFPPNLTVQDFEGIETIGMESIQKFGKVYVPGNHFSGMRL